MDVAMQVYWVRCRTGVTAAFASFEGITPYTPSLGSTPLFNRGDTEWRLMSFYLSCPKCGSTSVELQRDSRWNTGPRDFHFHCGMCGKTIYGPGVQMEVDRQYKLFVDEERRLKAARKEAAKAAKAAEAKRIEEERKLEAARAAVQSLNCAWGDCSALRRSTSIYCSRDCSNKNARARHKQRKVGVA